MTIVTPSLKIEMDLLTGLVDYNGDLLTDDVGNILSGNAYLDISADVLVDPAPTWTSGNSGRTIFDRVADIGTLSFGLNNSEANSDGLAGSYSPDNSNLKEGFGLDTNVRLSVIEDATTHQEWQGKINRINPLAGQYGPRKTMVSCEDWMADAARNGIRGITVQTNKRDDQLLTTLLNLAAIKPGSTNFSTGDETYSYALHDENSISSSMMRIMQKIAMSGLGKIFLSGFGVLNYLARSDLLIQTTPAATFSDSMSGLEVTRDKSQRVREVLITTYPVQVDTSPAVLWAAQRELQINAGETKNFDVSLRDPSGRATRIASASLETALADTDFKFSSVSGSGNDLNSDLSITYSLKADVVSVTLKNNSASKGYLWLHQIRGTGIYLYEPVTKSVLTGQPDGETIRIDMVYQDDPNVGDDIATLVGYWFATDLSDIKSMTFFANRNQGLMDAAFLQLQSLISVLETLTGINQTFLINGYSKSMVSKSLLQVTYYLTASNQLSNVWFLEAVGFSELDSTAYLGA